MSFTDDDLKRLEEHHNVLAYACACSVNDDHDHSGCIDVLTVQQFKALIARLEAAENFINSLPRYMPMSGHSYELSKRWYKSKGEGVEK